MTARTLRRYLCVVVALSALGGGGGLAVAAASGAPNRMGAPAATGTNGYETINIPPPPVTGPRGRARISQIVVTHKSVNVTAVCTGASKAVCVLKFQLSGGVAEGLAGAMTRTMVVGTHTFAVGLNAGAQAKLQQYRYFYAYLKILQTNATKSAVLLGRSFEMTAG